jgi:CRISPR-associated exonuclease Cas4/CRISPR-associated protein Cas1
MIYSITDIDGRLRVLVQGLGGVLHAESSMLHVRCSGPLGEQDSIFEPTSVTELVLVGSLSLSAPALQWCAAYGVVVHYYERDGWYHGLVAPPTPLTTNPLSIRQDEELLLELATTQVATRLRHQALALQMLGRTLHSSVGPTVEHLENLSAVAERAPARSVLMEIEEAGSLGYWREWRRLLRSAIPGWRMHRRHSRPYKDVANRVAGFADGLLARDARLSCHQHGILASAGFYHSDRPECPALMMDLMEPFRPLIADIAAFEAIVDAGMGEDEWMEPAAREGMREDCRARVFRAYEKVVGRPWVVDPRLTGRQAVLQSAAAMLQATD